MSSEFRQKSYERRNLVFAVWGVIILLVFLAVILEKHVLKVKPDDQVDHSDPQKHEVLTQTPVYHRTTVNIQPLVTKFPPLPDFNSFVQADQRKAAFIDYLAPIVEYQNEKILKERARLEFISKLVVNGEELDDRDRNWLQGLADKYEVTWWEDNPDVVVVKLARRVDIIPLSLAVVQAAKESSWGRSRYAIQANNIFGQWCYDEGCGVIPGDRADGAFHEVRRFQTVNDATRSYIHNLNTHPRYATLRQIREQLRLQRRQITGRALANGLLYYSERRQAYVDEVKVMIEQYQVFQDRRTG